MRITRCDRCGKEYEPKELEPVEIRDINVNRIRIGTNTGISDGTDLCQECLNEFKKWWERYDKPKYVLDSNTKACNVPYPFCFITKSECTRCKPGPCENRRVPSIVSIKTEE